MKSEARRLQAAIRIVQYQAGDDGAIEWLVDEYQQWVRRSITSRLGADRGVVDDVTQQVWLEVIRQLNMLREPMAWEAWLARIIQSHVFKHRRGKMREVASIDAARGLAARDGTRKWIDDEDLRSAVDRLSPHHRDLLVLRFWNSLSYKELAKRCEAPIGTIRSRLHLAKKQLAELLKKEV